ncbi:InlB B-repeat-containing protein [Bacillus sp. PK3_68]|uniref:InlB B-repeat-containing protein n=1 Tax=Bacillus sp. PK3_68 TaxID=2027408 RepID=UPI000E71C57E|nr:InlB B-repeat-containing protein [Bacillus sp. PK3_68]RJS60688.1 hypothetical protein CJ483_11890 [Bacillus sp. PK3_68]
MKGKKESSFSMKAIFVVFIMLIQLVSYFPAQSAANSADHTSSDENTIKETMIHTYDQNTWAFNTLAKGPNGEIYLAHKINASEIAIKKWNGSDWVLLTSVTTSLTGDTSFSDSLDLAVDSDGKLHLVFKHEKGSGVESHRGVKYGVFDGNAWSFQEIEAYSDSRGWKNFYDPAIAVDNTGKVHIVYIYDYAENHDHYLKYASNSTGSWKIDTLAQGSGGTGEIHDPDVAIDGSDAVHIAYVKEDNQNDYYGNYYYTSKKVSDLSFPTAQKLVDAVSEAKDYRYTPLTLDDGGNVYFAYYPNYNSVENFQSTTAYIHSNKSGSWKREPLYIESNRILYSLDLYASGSDVYGLVESWAPDWSNGYFVALKNDGEHWIVGNKTVQPALVEDYAEEWTYLVDTQGNFIMVLLHGELKKISSLTGTSKDFGLVPAAATHTVSYDGNGYTNGTIPVDTNAYEEGESVTILGNTGNLTKNGYVFAGWNTEADGSGIDYEPDATFQMGTNHIILFAKWVPELSKNADLSNILVSNGTLSPVFSSGTTNYTVNVANSLTSINIMPTVAHSKAAITINGSNATSGNAKNIPLHVGENTITVIVTAEDGISTKTYSVTVTRAASSNNDLSNLTVSKGELSPNFASSITSYTVTVENNVNSIDLTSTTADSTATLTVNGNHTDNSSPVSIPLNVGANTATIIVTAQNGETKTYQIIITREAPSDAELAQRDKDSLSIGYRDGDSQTSVTQNVTLPESGDNGSVIKWTSSHADFMSNQGIVTRPKFTEGNQTITLTATITKGETTLTKVFTLTMPTLEGYTVTYNENGAISGSVPGIEKYDPAQSVAVKENLGSLIKTGYTFTGWNTKSDGTGIAYKAGDSFTIEQNITLYAQWKLNQYTVTFNVDGGTSIESAVVNHGETLIKPLDPSKTGYTFAGWYKDSQLTDAYHFDRDTITQDTTLYSKWDIQSYKVTFNVNGGSAIASSSVVYNNKLEKPKDPKRPGYVFAGWYKDEKFKNKFIFDTLITDDMTLYARWSSNSGGGNPTPSPVTEEIVVDVVSGDKLLVQTPIKRTTAPDGTVRDDVTFTREKADESISKLNNTIDKTARIVIPDLNDQVSETMINVPQLAMKALENGKASLEIQTENARLFVPDASISGFVDDLFFHMVPVKDEAGHNAIKELAKQEKLVREITNGNVSTIKILGRPMTIETNMQNRPVTITIPLPANLPQEVINNMAIFIEHSDGTKEVIQGSLVEFKPGKQGIKFDVQKFSTFTVMYMEGAADYFSPNKKGEHELYIHGFKDGTFRPDETVTRAQTAAMLVRNLDKTYNGTSSYTDTKGSFAFKEIEMAREAGIIFGFKDGTFRPEQPITRAQMAAIASRWVDQMCKKETDSTLCHPTKPAINFKDVPADHWAAKAIGHASKIGIINGFSNGFFKPEQPITRAQIVIMLNRLFKRGPLHEVKKQTFKDVKMDHWAFKEIEEAATNHKYQINKDGKEILVP